MPFFAIPCAKSALKRMGKTPAKCELAVVSNRADLLMTMLGLIEDDQHKDINSMLILTGKHLDGLARRTERVFDETGLDIRLAPISKEYIRLADAVICDSSACEGFDYAFKKSAVYVSLDGNREPLEKLVHKRPDMTFVSSCSVFWHGRYITLCELERLLGSDAVSCRKLKQLKLSPHVHANRKNLTLPNA